MFKKTKNFIFYYWKSLIVIIGILYLSFAPPSTFKGIPTFEYEDKVVHLLLYAGLACILIFDYRLYSKRIQKSTFSFVLICLLFPLFLGGIVEVLQPMYFAPRTADFFDWFSDIIGVVVGWFAMQIINPNSL